MTNQFDLNRVGKRMPYKLPPNTFSQIEANVMATIQQEKPDRKHKGWLRWTSFAATAAAASVALALLLRPLHTDTQEELLLQVDKAYANLSEADQALLLEMDEDDLFMNPTQTP